MNDYMMSFIVGLLFGASLDLAGFGSPKRLNDQFLLRDFSMFKVMFGAIVLASTLYFGLVSMGFSEADPRTIPFLSFGIVLGGFILGFGLVLGGYCPGTSIVGFAGGRIDALVFFLSMYPGYRFWLWLIDRYSFEVLNQKLISESQIFILLGIPWYVMVVVLFVVALVGWKLGSFLEKKQT
ncbi:MAG: hypothetical protein A2622_08555 [Bdellovibrionales bacterium RIFCSPHIGHO2_01_FULL_40_29]|nr:MAG: hypothetical protein A2622_08555 [Bdellovibrionales bacterium RIFCSPHIGHO2_01_FULL_40_29]OFZ35539.1 MAG: hypothetical protein A3D17_07790 [Bdellovibrionales bacterium RIFCSPHIGHO2_02_FULL_40_15]